MELIIAVSLYNGVHEILTRIRNTEIEAKIVYFYNIQLPIYSLDYLAFYKLKLVDRMNETSSSHSQPIN